VYGGEESRSVKILFVNQMRPMIAVLEDCELVRGFNLSHGM
jgi:hypothetical protein